MNEEIGFVKNAYSQKRCDEFYRVMMTLHKSMVGELGINMDMKKWTALEKTVKVNIALEFAMFMHLGQLDKNKVPYIEHPIRVSECVAGVPEKIVALLHDTIEDTELKLEDLEYHFPTEILDAIDAMSKRKKEDYAGYINRLADNTIARRVKIADLNDNMSEARWCFGKRDMSNSMWKKYFNAFAYLIEVEKLHKSRR
jgi:hypothetical protein